MPVLAAGSGTVNDDNSLCINDKSGNYKPTPQSMELAKLIFEQTTGLTIILSPKANKEDLKITIGASSITYNLFLVTENALTIDETDASGIVVTYNRYLYVH